MSLALAAQHLAARGRNGDSTLVHMTPGEVAGLQALAHAHGQTLTINPETGLPEAFSLKSLLPMIGGAALSMVPGVGPLMAAGIMGGGTALATGSLQKGLMAGLGAYGGAGIGGALAGAGASAANTAATNSILAANPGLTAGEIGREMGTAGFVQPQLAANMNPATMSMTDKLTAGFKGLGTEAGRSAVMEQMGGLKGLAKYGGAALSPFLMAQSEQTQVPSSGPNPFQYDFNPGYTGPVTTPGGGTRFFDPRYTRRMADGGDTGMTGQSDDYYRYLMGLAPAPRPYTPAPVVAPAATQADTAPLTVTNPMAARRYDTYSDSMAFDDYNNPQNPNAWGNLTPMQQAAFYAANPPLAATTQALQGLFGATTLGQIQAALDPTGVAQAQSVANPGPGGYLSQLDYALLGMSPPAGPGNTPSNQSLTGGLLNFSGTQAPAPVDIAVPTISNAQAAQMMADEINASLGMTPVATPAAVSPGAVPVPVAPQVDLNPAALASFGAEGETAPGGTSFGSDIGYDSGVDSNSTASADHPGDKRGGLIRKANGGLSSLAAFANGGYNLGDYSDGGRLLRGPGDGVSDSIPASIADKRPARLADGEFVVPARIVSELGNGSTEAGARQLYAMMDRIQNARKKSVGKGKVAVNSRASKLLPA